MHRRTSRYDAIEWAKKLLDIGIVSYVYPDLPDNMKNIKLHLKASREGFVIKTGYGRKYSTGELVHKSKVSNRSSIATQYKVNQNVMKLTYSNQKV